MGQSQIFLTVSIAANSTADVTPTLIKTSSEARLLNAVAISGATVNTGKLHVKIAGTEITSNGIINGVTRTAGQVISSDDYVDMNYVIPENDPLVLEIDNTSAGALTYYVYYDIEDASDSNA